MYVCTGVFKLQIKWEDNTSSLILSLYHLVCIREDTHKKNIFFLVGPLIFYPPYTNGLVVYATFSSFFSLIVARNGFLQFIHFSPNFLAKNPGFKKKSDFFA